MVVVNHASFQLERTVASVDHITLTRATAREETGGDERLERRPRLEGLRERRRRGRTHVLASAREREDISPARIENDDGPPGGAHLRNGIGQGALGDLLQIVIEREYDRVPWMSVDARRVRRLEGAST